MAAKNTFGLTLDAWDTSGTPAYKAVGGIYDATPPTLVADDPPDGITHASSGGVHEFVEPKTFTWSECTVEMNELSDDVGQVLIAGNIGKSMKFKLTKASVSATPVLFNAIIISFVDGTHPTNGKATKTLTLKPTGVAPVS